MGVDGKVIKPQVIKVTGREDEDAPNQSTALTTSNLDRVRSVWRVLCLGGSHVGVHVFATSVYCNKNDLIHAGADQTDLAYP